MEEKIAVIGAGSTGLFTSIELARRGFSVSLFDRGIPGSGTSGRFHGLLHCGARYAVVDRTAATDCRAESERIKSIAPHCVNSTGGLFVALDRNDEEYGEELRLNLNRCSIPYTELNGSEAVRAEPNLNAVVRSAIRVPDAVLKGRRFLLSALGTCIAYGVSFHPFMNLLSAHDDESGDIEGLSFENRIGGGVHRASTDFVVNCSGPWIGQTSKLLGHRVEVLPAAGVMSVVGKRLTSSVVSRMRRPSDGDILVPYGETTIAGTTAAVTEDPASFEINEEDVGLLLDEASAMVPQIGRLGFARSYASFRPLVKEETGSVREVTRDFRILSYDAEPRNVVNVAGGKMTTSRLVGERTATEVCNALGVRKPPAGELRLIDPLDDIRTVEAGAGGDNTAIERIVAEMRGGTDDEDTNFVRELAALVMKWSGAG